MVKTGIAYLEIIKAIKENPDVIEAYLDRGMKNKS